MLRIQLGRKTVEQFRPLHFQLPVHQFLRPLIVFYPDEAVALLHVLEAFFIHLPGQPLPPVQSDLDIEGKPGLDPLTTGEDAKVSFSGDKRCHLRGRNEQFCDRDVG